MPNLSSSARLSAALFVYSQTLMAGSAVALLFAATKVMAVSISGWWYLVAGLGAWMVYLLDSARSRDAEDRRSQPERADLFRRHRLLRSGLPWLAGGLGLVATILARPGWEMVVLLAALGLVGLGYVIPALPPQRGQAASSGRRTLKQFAALKPLTICVAWTAGATLVPLLAAATVPVDAAWTACWLGALFFPLLLADSLLLDLRDRDGDRAEGLRTVAVRLGTIRTHQVVGGCLAVTAVVVILGGARVPLADAWLRVGLAGLLGLGTAWLMWSSIRRNECSTAVGMMAWRYLAAVAAI